MKIVAFAVGSDGDVLPFIALGKELKLRGYDFCIVTFSCFQEKIKKNGLSYGMLHGDPQEMMRKMLSEGDEGEGPLAAIGGLLGKYPQLYEEFCRPCKSSDLIMYMQFGGLAYHFAQKFNKPCIRTFALPYDPTRLYSPLFPYIKRNSLRCKISYYISDMMMNWAARATVNEWRKNLQLGKWHIYSSYKKMNGAYIPTLYQYSNVLIPRDPAWKEHIYVTGEWEEPNTGQVETKEIDSKLREFIEGGEPPIYIGFGSIVSHRVKALQEKLIAVLEKTGQRAVFVSAWSKFDTARESKNIFYAEFVPFSWLFPRVSAVVHHGGAGTLSLAIRAGKPNFILGFGGDQYFRGLQAYELGVGPKPVDVLGTEITEELLLERLTDLKAEKYKKAAREAAARMQKEHGCAAACDIIENYIQKTTGA